MTIFIIMLILKKLLKLFLVAKEECEPPNIELVAEEGFDPPTQGL